MKEEYTAEEDRKIIEQYLLCEAENILKDMGRITNELTIRFYLCGE